MSNPTAGPERIAAIRERERRATPGPWKFQVVKRGEQAYGTTMIGAVAPGHQIRANPPGGSYPSNDGEFIAHAREDIAFLLDALAAAQGAGAASREQILAAVDAEEELNGPLPAHMRTAFLESPENSMRATVRATKAGIRARLEALFAEAPHE